MSGSLLILSGLILEVTTKGVQTADRRFDRTRYGVLLIAMACFMPGGLIQAASISSFALESDRDGYRLRAQSVIDAPNLAVWNVLTDYARLHRLSARILESEVLAVTADGTTRLRTLNRLCVLVFCSRLRHVQLIRELGYGDFESYSVPEESDLVRGYARWQLADLGAATLLEIEFHFALESYSWIPSVISRFVVRSALESDAQALVEGIEHAARQEPERAW